MRRISQTEINHLLALADEIKEARRKVIEDPRSGVATRRLMRIAAEAFSGAVFQFGDDVLKDNIAQAAHAKDNDEQRSGTLSP